MRASATLPTLDIEAIRRAADIAAIVRSRGVELRRASREWVGRCPFHEDNNPSFYVAPEKRGGVFHCWVCDVAGDAFAFIQKIDGVSFPEAARIVADLSGVPIPDAGGRPMVRRAVPPEPKPIPPPPTIAPVRPDLAEHLTRFQAALPGSLGEEYLKRRGIPLELAQRYGVGYAAPRRWIGNYRQHGRVAFPHHTPDDGTLINLYGRAVDTDQKPMKHDHLTWTEEARAKGEDADRSTAWFNAAAVSLVDAGPLFITEGPFDAMALIAAGCPRTVALFGLNNLRWDWLTGVSGIVFALDMDKGGTEARLKFTTQARVRGKDVWFLNEAHYGGEKDASAAWAAGALRIGGIEA